MPGQYSCLNALAVRKRLLIAEADLQRQQLREELTLIETNLHELGAQARSASSILTAGSLALASFWLMRRIKRTKSDSRSGMLSKLWRGAKMAASLWLALRPQHRRRLSNLVPYSF